MKHISIKIKEEKKVRCNLSNREYAALIKAKTHKETRKVLEEMGYILDSYEKQEDEIYGSIEIIKETERYATKKEYLEWLDIMKDKIEDNYDPTKIKLLKNKEIQIIPSGDHQYRRHYDYENNVCKDENNLCFMEKPKIHDPNTWSTSLNLACASCCLAGCGTDERALSFGGEKIKKEE